jgi:hypothetical protein
MKMGMLGCRGLSGGYVGDPAHVSGGSDRVSCTIQGSTGRREGLYGRAAVGDRSYVRGSSSTGSGPGEMCGEGGWEEAGR